MTSNGQMTVDSVLGITMSRRRALRLLGAAGAATMVAGVAQVMPAHAAQQLRTLSSLNLRAKPRSDARVLRVMPEGALVDRIPGGSGRYVKVIYDGTRGYAHLDYLDDANVDQPTDSFPYQAITTDWVNLRSGPSTGHRVIRVLSVGTEILTSDRLENGFRYINVGGTKGWIWNEYISGGDGGVGILMRTTSAVNFRTSPSTTASIIQVIPSGTQVFGLGESSNGFEKIRYNNRTGWVYGDYVR